MAASIQVYWTGMKATVWRFLIGAGIFFVCPILFACLVGSTWSFCFTVCWLWSKIYQSLVWWYQHMFRIFYPFLVMLTVYSPKIDLYPASHNFPIETRDMCERHGSQWSSIILGGNRGNASVHAVFDGGLLSHADERNSVGTRLCEFSLG